MKKLFKVFLTALLVLVSALCMAFASTAAESENWVGAWSTAPTKIGISGYDNITAAVEKVTSRSVITVSASGSKIRIRFSNIHGTKPLTLHSVTVAKSAGGSAIDTSTLRYVTFDGSPTVTIEPKSKTEKGYVYSDPISFNVTAGESIAVSIYVKKLNEITTMGLSGSTSYIAMGEDQTREKNLNLFSDFDIDNEIAVNLLKQFGFDMGLQMQYSFIKVTPCIEAVDVLTTTSNGYSVAVIGDSTVSNEFPQYLAEEIIKTGTTDVGVLGKGIIGNRIGGEGLGYGSLIFGESMIDRLDADVLSQSGVKYAIIKIGANDIMHPVCTDIQEQYPGIKQPTAEQLIEYFKQAFEKLHKAGIKVVVIGITQWKGNDRDYLGTGPKYVRTEAEFKKDWQIALDVNEWLATTAASEGLHDGYVNFNDISANPNDPEAFLPEYTIDGAHPSDTLQKIWAQNFPLSLIGISTRVGNVRINKSSLTLQTGKTERLSSEVIPADAVNRNVTWHSTNTSVADVDSNGLVIAKGGGKCEIICTSAENASITAKCTVTVTVPVTGVQISTQSAELYTTKTLKLSAEVFPSSATEKKVEWSSGNERIATVDKNGLVTAVGSGTVAIICKTVDGGYTSRCELTVLSKISPERVVLSKTSTTIRLGKTDLLSASVLPENATFKDVTYKSSNTKVVTVDSYGLITTIGTGSATITVTANDNNFATAKCKVDVVVDVTGLSLNKAAHTVYAGDTFTLVPTVYPLNATNKKVTWLSSDDSIASVNANGTVTAKRAGNTVITCETDDGNFIDVCTLTVKKVIKTKSVSLNKLSFTLYVGRTRKLVATVSPENATNKALKWTSSNKKVAKVDQNGVVTAVGKGTATITCATKDTGKTTSCEVTVKNVKVKSISLSKSKASLTVKGTLKLDCVFNPADTTVKDVTWTSSDPSVAKVDKNGKVTAVAPGTATITCKTKYRNKTATCTVTVTLKKIKTISFKNSTVEMVLGTTQTLKPTIKPKGATGAKLKWESSDPSVVKVNKNGKLTALKTGKALITCRPADGGNGKGSVVLVTVIKRDVLGIKLDKSTVKLGVNSTLKLTATVVPEDATNKKIKWTSTDPKVATVNSKGVVTAVGKGSCEIRATTVDGNYIAMCWIIVA